MAQDPRTTEAGLGAAQAWPAALLELVERMELASRRGPLDPDLLRQAADLLPPGPTGAGLRLELERMAAALPAPQARPHELCSVSDAAYLPRLLALVASLDRQDPGGYRLHVACLDDGAAEALSRLGHPRVVPLPARELERDDPQLAAVRPGRSVSEYSWTLKASLVLFLLERHPEVEALTYLDGDLFFFSPVRELLRELGTGSVLIHRHNFSRECAGLEAQSGPYNAGMVAFRNDGPAREVLRWWRERCLEWCYNRFEGGRFADQTYLSGFTARCPGLVESRRLGVGTALWSQGNAPVVGDPAGPPRIGGEPVVFSHMHGFDTVRPGLHVPSKDLYYRPTLALVRHLYLPYVRAVEAGLERTQELCPGWAHRGFAGVTPRHALLARRELRPLLREAGLRNPVIELDGTWDCHAGQQLEAG